MPDYTTQVAIPMDTGIGADSVVNTWHMADNGLVGPSITTKIQSWHTALQTFYNSISGIFTADINHSLVRMKTFDLDDPKPRIPLVDELKPFSGTGSSASLPHELCIVLSFNSVFQSGVKPSHRRGRVFLGPINQSHISSGSPDAKILSTTRTLIATAAGVLRTGPTPDQGWFWRTRSSYPASNSSPHVVNGYVDDAWDIQRRRGTLASARTTF